MTFIIIYLFNQIMFYSIVLTEIIFVVELVRVIDYK